MLSSLTTATGVVKSAKADDNTRMTKEMPLLFGEVRALYHVVAGIAETLHHDLEVTVSMRAVLEFLEVEGPRPVPEIARARGVSRQRVQALVDALKVRGLVRVRDNPDHRRSVIIELTPAGRALIRKMRQREVKYLEERGIDLTDPALRRAWRTLAELRRRLESRSGH